MTADTAATAVTAVTVEIIQTRMTLVYNDPFLVVPSLLGPETEIVPTECVCHTRNQEPRHILRSPVSRQFSKPAQNNNLLDFFP